MQDKFSAFSKNFDGDFYSDSLHQKLYATDASVYRKLPAAVAFPKSTKGIQQLIRLASENQIGLIPRTAGTSLAGQCVGEGIIVDVSKYFTEIVDLDVDEKIVRVQPGVIRDELNTFLAPYELFFGPNTSTSNRCMIGGMVGNNSSGTTSIQYGVTRDKVISLKAILSNGEEVTFRNFLKEKLKEKREEDSLEGKIYEEILSSLSKEEYQEAIDSEFPKKEIHRRNTGYALDALLDTEAFDRSETPFNLSKILCGSEGTLAFITEITLQLDSAPPPYTAMVVTEYETISNCMKDVIHAMKHELYTCELMDQKILDCTKNNKTYEAYRFFLQGNPKAMLMLELRAENQNELNEKVSQLISSLKVNGLSNSQVVLTGEEIDQALELRKAGLGLLGNMVGDRKAVACIEDTAVAVSDLPEYIQAFDKLMASYNQEAVYYAHAGAGELHLRPILNLKSSKEVRLFRKITSEVAELVKKFKGSLSGEHGDGIVRGEFIRRQVGDKNFSLMQSIKNVFDPIGIFNPGKITDAWPMDASLRYEIDREEPEVKTIMDFQDSGGLLRLAEKCNGSGDCRKTEKSNGMLCPSYHATKDEKDSTRGRANVLREVLTHSSKANKFDDETLNEAFKLCVGCKACSTECPSNVDMASAKVEFLYQYQKQHSPSLGTWFFAKNSKINALASRWPNVSNAVSKGVIGNLIKRITGVAKKRTLPTFSSPAFNKSIHETYVFGENRLGSVNLFIDEFTNYLEAGIAHDAVTLLTHIGYEVEVITHLDSARALISMGFLEDAKSTIDQNIKYLKNKVSESKPLLGIEPSGILGFRDEYLRLASDKDSAKSIAQKSFLIEEFLANQFQNKNFGKELFTKQSLDIKIHVHCHQKALSNSKITFDFLNMPENYHPRLIPSGCCGMAGSFGYEKENYEVSMKIGETKLFPAIRNTPEKVIIAANGTSCRHQIKDGTGREAFHPISILKQALKEG